MDSSIFPLSNFRQMSEEQLYSSKDTDEEKEIFLRNVNAYKYNQFLEKIIPNCFKMCVSKKPGQSLSHYEQNCIVRCTDLYVRTWLVTAKAFTTRVEDDSKPYNVSEEYFE
ncbi:TIMM13 family protein [Megaselia abdita]